MGSPNGNGTKKSTPQRVLEYALMKVGKKAPGKGECWDLPYEALVHARARLPHCVGSNDTSPDCYVWGTRVENLKDAQPGDVLQFFGVRTRFEYVRADGRSAWEELTFRERHSAIVERVDPNFVFTTINAHLKGDHGKVTRRVMHLPPEAITRGNILLYRPTDGGAKL